MLTLSRTAIGVVVVGVVLLVGLWGFEAYRGHALRSERDSLRIENARIASQYDQKIGEARAHEATAVLRTTEGDAFEASAKAHKKTAEQIADAITASREWYEEEKAKQGVDCVDDIDSCLKLYCQELLDARMALPESCKRFELKPAAKK